MGRGASHVNIFVLLEERRIALMIPKVWAVVDLPTIRPLWCRILRDIASAKSVAGRH